MPRKRKLSTAQPIQGFLSWSGPTSKRVAEKLKDWLSVVERDLLLWYSPATSPGLIWPEEIRNAIRGARIGILVVTPDNREEPWLLWEAGALSNLESGLRVIPFLFHLSEDDLPAPLHDRQAAIYRGNEDHDKASILAFVHSILEVIEKQSDPPRPTGWLQQTMVAAEKTWPLLRTELTGIRAPVEQQLENALRDVTRGLAHLQRRRVAALNVFGFGSYTTFIATMAEFLRQYQRPQCLFFNDIQPGAYVTELLRTRAHDPSQDVDERQAEAFLSELADPKTGELTALFEDGLSKELSRVFPSIATIAAFAKQGSERVKRISLIDRSRKPPARRKLELQFMDRLMLASDDHYVVDVGEAARAVSPMLLHRSDFSLWKCEEIEILTDYYPASSTLLVAWRLPGESGDPYLGYYDGLFKSILNSPGTKRIRDYIAAL